MLRQNRGKGKGSLVRGEGELREDGGYLGCTKGVKEEVLLKYNGYYDHAYLRRARKGRRNSMVGGCHWR